MRALPRVLRNVCAHRTTVVQAPDGDHTEIPTEKEAEHAELFTSDRGLLPKR